MKGKIYINRIKNAFNYLSQPTVIIGIKFDHFIRYNQYVLFNAADENNFLIEKRGLINLVAFYELLLFYPGIEVQLATNQTNSVCHRKNLLIENIL
jgi:hypothetical protein